jgi:hypothetical protein
MKPTTCYARFLSVAGWVLRNREASADKSQSVAERPFHGHVRLAPRKNHLQIYHPEESGPELDRHTPAPREHLETVRGMR